ncbi:LNS2 domain-containing protein [Prauserella flavalba]|uniref:LNS2 domain-containing protein n=1 Tax=Prauserella flavalba TaxID=1477506 RepID=UPI0036E88F17
MAGEGIVVFDIDGGLADMSAVADQFGPNPWGPRAWNEFFARLDEAAVIEAGRALAAATAALGFTVLYSTTRPYFTTRATREWLAAHDFPRAAALFSRPSPDARTPAVEIKLRHCRIVEQRLLRGYLAAFVDDEPDVVTALRSHGYASRRFDRLHGCDLVDLHAALVFGPGRREFTEREPLGRARIAHRTAFTAPSNLASVAS